jgi:Fe-S-cluster containining protein
MADHIGFLCNACGKCCNTPPAMSVPELFRHRDRFIGSLAVGRVRRLAAGSRIGAGGTGQTGDRVLDEDGADALAALRDSVFHRSEDGWVTLITQAFDYASVGRCPALGSDNTCAVHGQDKPLMCRVKPRRGAGYRNGGLPRAAACSRAGRAGCGKRWDARRVRWLH